MTEENVNVDPNKIAPYGANKLDAKLLRTRSCFIGIPNGLIRDPKVAEHFADVMNALAISEHEREREQKRGMPLHGQRDREML